MNIINIEYTEIVNIERDMTIEEKVMHEFTKRLKITPKQIMEHNKEPLISDIRYLYCKLRYDMHGVTFKTVGLELGRSYSTVWYGVHRINDLLDRNDEIILDLWNKVKDIGELL